MQLELTVTLEEATEDQTIFIWWSYHIADPLSNMDGFQTLHGNKDKDTTSFQMEERSMSIYIMVVKSAETAESLGIAYSYSDLQFSIVDLNYTDESELLKPENTSIAVMIVAGAIGLVISISCCVAIYCFVKQSLQRKLGEEDDCMMSEE